MKHITDFDPDVVLAAASDNIRMSLGERLEHPHPLAYERMTLADIAQAAGRKLRAPRPEASLGMGITSADFGRVMATAFEGSTLTSYGNSVAEALAFCTRLEVRNFQPVELPAYDSSLALEQVGELGEISHGVALLAAGSQPIKLTSYARNILVTREAIINDERNVLSEIFGAAGSNVARLERSLIANALENPADLTDGLPVYGSEYLNVVEEPMSGPALGLAMQHLRNQVAPSGQKADLRGRHLVCAPNLEFLALGIVRETGLNIEIHVLADLPAGRWFLLASPAECPTIAVLRLASSSSPVRVEPKRTKLSIDGSLIRIRADLGATMLRRTGLVRGGVVAP